jgi:uncharacterized protein YqhQ
MFGGWSFMPVTNSQLLLMSQNNQPLPNFNYGGQAVLEGVMMRGSQAMAVAVRDPQGNIVTHTEPLDQRVYGSKIMKMPFVRGLTLLWDAMGLGVKALMFSAEVSIEEEEATDAKEISAEEKADAIFSAPVQYGTVILSLAMGIGLFIALPAFLAGLIENLFNLDITPFVSNLIEGVFRLLIVTGYISLIGMLPDIKRLYGYHGAEHKTINAYEDGAELTPVIVAKYPIEHPRCGTAFLLTVVIISVLLYSVFPEMNLLVRVLSRLALLPVIAGISYEFLRFTAKHQDNPIIRFITIPNLMMQRLTTREPDLDMLAVAITSFNHVIAFERGEDPTKTEQAIFQPTPVA